MKYHPLFHKITAYRLTEKYSSFDRQLYCTYVSCVTSKSIRINRPLNVRLVKSASRIQPNQAKPNQANPLIFKAVALTNV